MIKKIILLVSFILSLNFIFSYTYEVRHNGAEGASLYYCNNPPSTSNNCETSTGNLIDSKNGKDVFILNYFDTGNNYFKKLLTQKENKRLVFGIWTDIEGKNYVEPFDFNGLNVYFTPYLTPLAQNSNHNVYNQNFNNKDLQGNVCLVSIGSLTTTQVKLTPSLNPITKITSNTKYDVPEELLKKYYYMKAEVSLNILKDNDVVKQINLNSNSYTGTNYNYGNVNSPRYVILKDNSQTNTFNFNLPSLEELGEEFGEGTYTLEITVKPIDGKCDLNENNGVDNNEIRENKRELEIGKYEIPYIGIDKIRNPNNSPECSQNREIGEMFQCLDDEKLYFNGEFIEKGITKIKGEGGLYECRKEVLFVETDVISCEIGKKDSSLEVKDDNGVIELDDKVPLDNKLSITPGGAIVLGGIIENELYLDDIVNENITTTKEEFAVAYHKTNRIKDGTDPSDLEAKLNSEIARINDLKYSKKLIQDGRDLIVEYNFSNVKKDEVVYLHLSKDMIKDLRDAEGLNSSFSIQETDPILLWRFLNQSYHRIKFFGVSLRDYEDVLVMGDIENAYNLGELIFRYSYFEKCLSNELFLYSISDIDGPSISKSESNSRINICLNHQNKSYNLANRNNLVFSSNGVDVNLDVSNDNLFFHKAIVKTAPSTKHSCMGSVDNILEPTKVGDCDAYPDNRLWIYLGKLNPIPIETTLEVRKLSNKKAIIYFETKNNLTKAYTNYRITDKKNVTEKEGTYDYSKDIELNCKDDEDSCLKKVFFYSYDEFKIEEEKEDVVAIYHFNPLSCKSDCTAANSYGRVVRSCMGYGGCSFYKYNDKGEIDDGKYASSICDASLVEDGWVSFSDTKELKCPKGPLRERVFTNEKLEIDVSDSCVVSRTKKFRVIIDGMFSTMSILMCKKESFK